MSNKSDIYLFESEGQHNIVEAIDLAVNNAKQHGLKLVIFTSAGKGIDLAIEKGFSPVNLIGVFFPKDFIPPKDKTVGLIDEKKKSYEVSGVKIIQADIFPFKELSSSVPSTYYSNPLRNALAVFSGGMPLVIQSVLMAFYL